MWAVAAVLVAAVFAVGIAVGRGSAKDPERSESQPTYTDTPFAGGNYTPPVMVKVVGTVREAGEGICVLDVTAVYTSLGDWRDFKEDSRFKENATIRLADGSSWDFTPGESLSFRYRWCEKGTDGPEAGDEVYLLFRTVFPDAPLFSEPGEMYFVTEEE